MTSTPHSPSEMFASIPGIFGFYPEESIVVLTLMHTEESCYQLGPVMRLDLKDLRYLSDIGDTLSTIEPDLVFGLIISQQKPEAIEDLKGLIEFVADCEIVPFDACWYTSAIESGGKYDAIWLNEAMTEAALEYQSWRKGRIPLIANTGITGEMIHAGHLPELSRKDIEKHYAQAEESEQWDEYLIAERYAELFDDPSTSFRSAQECIDAFSQAVELMRTEKLITDGALTVAAFLKSKMSRDIVIEYCVLNANTVKEALCYVSRHTKGFVRANALALYALCIVDSPWGNHITCVLQAAHNTLPFHHLTALVAEAYYRGLSGSIVDLVINGSQEAQKHFGESTNVKSAV
ncbi:DUF4192 domain-containing protein [Corynebacterium diphtheriae]|uniref:DUF4192 domain-containing protein n=1 Tax=Corynebacterium diphtheriae TaxID=1717 RepID=UPI000D06FD51|nr:DUF4192 domain-containing protein [Corynebacterium diphtheriae]PSA74558.1 hypothetical protein BT092_06395 [Corynebacterium diphtheriae]